jgi:hypothetical protein
MSFHSPQTRSVPISFAASGDNIVIASGNYPLSVYCLLLTVGGATNLTLKSSTATSGAIILTGNGSAISKAMSDEPYYHCNPGIDFIINSSNAVQVSGILWYTRS